MYEYTDEDRDEVQSRINDPRYQNKPCDLAFAYELYDLLRINLECLGDIDKRLTEIENKLS